LLWHVFEHVPLLQTSPLPHCLPHAPQLFGSIFVSAHFDPQSVVPPPHVVAHLPTEHTSPDGHAVPQVPQLALSVCGSTHVPEQSVLGALHPLVVPSLDEPSVVPPSKSPPVDAHPTGTAIAAATATTNLRHDLLRMDPPELLHDAYHTKGDQPTPRRVAFALRSLQSASSVMSIDAAMRSASVIDGVA
jgi:hypothetical protein